MRVTIDSVVLDLTDAQVADLRAQLGVDRSTADGAHISNSATGGARLGMLTTDQKARQLGFSPEYVRDHARELGGVKMGDGPKAQWRFPADLGVRKLTPASVEKPSPPPRRRAPRR